MQTDVIKIGMHAFEKIELKFDFRPGCNEHNTLVSHKVIKLNIHSIAPDKVSSSPRTLVAK